VTPSNEHLVHEHVAERLTAAAAHRARRRVPHERPEPPPAGTRQHRTVHVLTLPLHPTKKGTPA
jgi:hypothetical protein